MGLSKKAMMKKLSLVLFLMTFITATVEARFDSNTFLAEMFKDNGEPNYYMKSTTTACCDNCFCTKSIPPQCHCSDVEETCHSACKACLCTRTYPPKCRCADIKNFCYDKCCYTDKTQIAAN